MIELTPVAVAVRALKICRDFLRQSETDVEQLNWAVISGHQAFMVAALAGTTGTGALTRSGHRGEEVLAYIAALRSREYPPPPPPEKSLAFFLELYEFIQDESEGSAMRRYVDSHAFVAGPNDTERVTRLNDLRNALIHYSPGGWLLDPGYAIEALLGAYSVLAFLIEQSHFIPWYPAKVQEIAVAALHDVSASLDRLCDQHGISRRHSEP